MEASKEVGKAVAPMVIELVKLRNQAARQLDTEISMKCLDCQRTNVDEIVSIFDELKKLTDERSKSQSRNRRRSYPAATE